MTKNQHLIWRKYLAPWTDDITSTKGNIAYFNKITGKEKERKSICTIGCEKYTYDISTINEKDKEAILRYFNEWLNRFKSETKYVKAEFLKSDKILERDYIEHNFIGVIEQKGIKMLNDLYAGKFPFENPTISQQDWECRFDFLNSYLFKCSEHGGLVKLYLIRLIKQLKNLMIRASKEPLKQCFRL